VDPTRVAAAIALAFPLIAWADSGAPVRSLGTVTVTGEQPTSLPTQIPTTTESATREQIGRSVNAADSEDALKYFPSLLVRKRYTGDYNHGVLSSRASGTGNSARSAVYADGILLSNFLGNGVGGLSFPPRWGMVTPEEIERVDVMYGPFAAMYPGNSVGAVVDYVTRMPKQFEVHAATTYVSQPFDLYGTHQTFRAWESSASVGNRNGDWRWWLDFNHTDSESQPLTFATRLVSKGSSGSAGIPVSGAFADTDKSGNAIYVLGSGTQYRTLQDHVKAKLAYDISPTLRASYVLGVWRNGSSGGAQSYLRDASGGTVYGGGINVNGLAFTGGQALTGTDFALTQESLVHTMQGFSLKQHGGGEWNWEIAASSYDYGRDQKRQSGTGNTLPASKSGGAGTVADGSGTGWDTLALKGIWRPRGDAHVVEFGFQQERYRLRYLTSDVTGNYLADAPGATASDVRGRTELRSLYAQDAWTYSERWKAVLGLRAESWTAFDAFTGIAAVPPVATAWPNRREAHLSPKAALSWQWLPDTVLKFSAGRAVRFPTVGELYGATSTSNAQFINDPKLKPERSWTTELSAQKEIGEAIARLTFFAEDTHDALYSQTVLDPAANLNVTRVQNVGRIATKGIELAASGADVWRKGLDLAASITYADSRVRENAGFAVVPGDTIGKWQPNVPRWRATALAIYRFAPAWSASLGARYSGRQYRTLDNSDVNGFTYQGASKYFTTDLRVRWQLARQWTAAFGIDNLNNYKYWNFHPYPQRSYSAELKFDL
jgi:iron complex outermembrane recepter protein